MRVLGIGNMYPPQSLGGYEVTWLSSNLDLMAAGHDVRVLTSDVRFEPGKGEEHDGVFRQLRWYWENHEWPRRSLRERVAIERHNRRVLASHIAEFEPDVAAFWAMGGMSLALLEHTRAAGLRAVGVVGDDWMVYGPEVDPWTRMHRRRPWLRRVTAPLGLPSAFDPGPAALWLFNSATTRSHAEQAGLAFPRAEIAHPGIDQELFAPDEPGEWQRRILCLGRVDPRKGIATAVSALAELPGYTLSVIGAGDARHLGELRALARDAGVENRITFGQARREELQDVYAAHDVLLFPVQWVEPWGLVPLEAMAVGRPVVAADAGGPAEYLEHEKNALLVERGAAPGAFAAAVRRLEDDRELRARLVSAGRVTASRFTAAAYNQRIRSALEREAVKP